MVVLSISKKYLYQKDEAGLKYRLMFWLTPHRDFFPDSNASEAPKRSNAANLLASSRLGSMTNFLSSLSAFATNIGAGELSGFLRHC